MKRRAFLATSGALAGGIGVAGCLGGSSEAPPRQSKVFSNVSIQDGALLAEFESNPTVQGRVGLDTSGALGRPGGALGSVVPVGVASAQGTTSGVPRAPNGWRKRQTGSYDEWWEANGDKVTEYEATITQAGFGYFGQEFDYEGESPGPAPLDWQRSFDNPGQSAGWKTRFSPGWYRIGARLKAKNDDHSFNWEFLDVKLAPVSTPAGTTTGTPTTTADAGGDDQEEFEIVAHWKVSAGL